MFADRQARSRPGSSAQTESSTSSTASGPDGQINKKHARKRDEARNNNVTQKMAKEPRSPAYKSLTAGKRMSEQNPWDNIESFKAPKEFENIQNILEMFNHKILHGEGDAKHDDEGHERGKGTNRGDAEGKSKRGTVNRKDNNSVKKKTSGRAKKAGEVVPGTKVKKSREVSKKVPRNESVHTAKPTKKKMLGENKNKESVPSKNKGQRVVAKSITTTKKKRQRIPKKQPDNLEDSEIHEEDALKKFNELMGIADEIVVPRSSIGTKDKNKNKGQKVVTKSEETTKKKQRNVPKKKRDDVKESELDKVDASKKSNGSIGINEKILPRSRNEDIRDLRIKEETNVRDKKKGCKVEENKNVIRKKVRKTVTMEPEEKLKKILNIDKVVKNRAKKEEPLNNRATTKRVSKPTENKPERNTEKIMDGQGAINNFRKLIGLQGENFAAYKDNTNVRNTRTQNTPSKSKEYEKLTNLEIQGNREPSKKFKVIAVGGGSVINNYVKTYNDEVVPKKGIPKKMEECPKTRSGGASAYKNPGEPKELETKKKKSIGGKSRAQKKKQKKTEKRDRRVRRAMEKFSAEFVNVAKELGALRRETDESSLSTASDSDSDTGTSSCSCSECNDGSTTCSCSSCAGSGRYSEYTIRSGGSGTSSGASCSDPSCRCNDSDAASNSSESESDDSRKSEKAALLKAFMDHKKKSRNGKKRY